MKFLRLLLSLPKTIYFNLKVFPIKKAVRLPVLVSYNVRLGKLYKDSILLPESISMFMIKFNWDRGSEGVAAQTYSTGYLYISSSGSIEFKGRASFAIGMSIRIDDGNLVIGNQFFSNKNCSISCSKRIVIGDNALLGWNVTIRDSDGHAIYHLSEQSSPINPPKPVIIENKVWIGSNVTLLKGVTIMKGSVIGYNSCVTKSVLVPNAIIAGYPAIIVRESIEWNY